MSSDENVKKKESLCIGVEIRIANMKKQGGSSPKTLKTEVAYDPLN